MSGYQQIDIKDPARFARLIPEGLDAERALDCVYQNPMVSEYHRGHLRVERKQRIIEASSDSDQASKAPPQQLDYWGGHYSLSLHDRTKEPGLTPWRVGKGSSRFNEADRGVDLLLIGPKDQSHGVSIVHAIIRFHPRSGVLMLVGVLDEKPIHFEDDGGSGKILLGKGQQRVLYRRRSRFRLGNLEYALEFEQFSEEEYSSYLAVRNGMYEVADQTPPHPRLSAIPGPADSRIGLVVTHGSMNTGKFGWVYAGVDARNGDPLAIKEHQPKSPGDLQRIMREIGFGKRFSKTIGILPTSHAFCEHRHDGICGQVPQKVYSASPLAIGDFHRFRLQPCSPHQLFQFYRSLLQGLQALHTAGVMHRDIHRANLLITATEPPQAVLCDFGKSIEATTDTYEFLGPISTRAPEIDGVTPYDNKIDIWSLGFSYCEIAFPALQSGLDRTKPIDRAWHTRITAYLEQPLGKENSKDTLCIDLLFKLLDWEPDNRISAAEALRHPYFSPSPAPPGASPEGLYHKSRPSQQPVPRQQSPRGDPAPDPNAQQSSRHTYRPARPAPAPQAPLTGYGPNATDRLFSSETKPSHSSSTEEPMGASMLAWHRERDRRINAANNPPLLYPPMKRR